jgi:hypothetical protein
MTPSGRHAWRVLAQPKIRAYYEQVLGDFSVNDMAHVLHYLLRMLENMERLDAERGLPEEDEAGMPRAAARRTPTESRRR